MTTTPILKVTSAVALDYRTPTRSNTRGDPESLQKAVRQGGANGGCGIGGLLSRRGRGGRGRGGRGGAGGSWWRRVSGCGVSYQYGVRDSAALPFQCTLVCSCVCCVLSAECHGRSVHSVHSAAGVLSNLSALSAKCFQICVFHCLSKSAHCTVCGVGWDYQMSRRLYGLWS